MNEAIHFEREIKHHLIQPLFTEADTEAQQLPCTSFIFSYFGDKEATPSQSDPSLLGDFPHPPHIYSVLKQLFPHGHKVPQPPSPYSERGILRF